MTNFRQDFAFGLRMLLARPGIQHRRGLVAGARHRRQHDDLQPHQLIAARTSPLSRAGMALGAGGGRVMRLVTLRAMILIAIGLVLGLGGAMALTRVLASELFEVSPTDPLTFTFVPIGLTVVALVAPLIPTRRAMTVDPTVALRYE